jgi:acetyltransferase-like isoleucine patch superfamily enzyme
MRFAELCLRLVRGVSSRLRNLKYSLLGVRLLGYVWMRGVSIPRSWRDITIEGAVALDDGVVLLCTGDSKPDKIFIGRGTYINRYSFIDASHSIEVGSDCLIGPGCYITDHDHGTATGSPMRQQALVSNPVRIGNNVWIGANATILKGVTIGDNAIVGAGSVVTRDIAAGQTAVGVPARSKSAPTLDAQI